VKRCGRCGLEKPLEEFAWRRRAKNQRHNYCRPCHSDYHREHYLANKQRYVDQAAASRKKLRHERTAFLLEYFAEHPCVDCGETDPIVLEFDHLRDKAFDIGKGLPERAWASVLAEIEKCEVVCANCHRRRTSQRKGTVRLLLSERSSEDD